MGSTLRSRSLEEKALTARRVEAELLPLVEAGKLRVLVGEVFALESAADAYARSRPVASSERSCSSRALWRQERDSGVERGGQTRFLRWTKTTPPPADPVARHRLARETRWSRGLRCGRVRPLDPGDHDLIPILPRGTALFDGIPAPAIVIEALEPVIGDGALVSRRSGSVGVILIKEASIFEVYAFEGGERLEGQKALQLISTWTDATMSAYQLDRLVVAVAPSLYRGTPCYENLRLEWTDWKGLLTDLCSRDGLFVVELDTPFGPRGHPDPRRTPGGHLHRGPSGAWSRESAGSTCGDQAGDDLGPPRAADRAGCREAGLRSGSHRRSEGT